MNTEATPITLVLYHAGFVVTHRISRENFQSFIECGEQPAWLPVNSSWLVFGDDQ